MKLATRINSFLAKKKTVSEALDEIGKIDGLTHVDLNYPEHFNGENLDEIKEALARNNLKINGLAVRFREDFVNGELSNNDPEIAARAKELCKKGVDLSKELGGQLITIWLGYDGYDYPFQLDYAKAWKQVVKAIQEIADYDRGMRISIEYKPYEPRSHSLVSSIGTTLLLINDVGRKNVGVTLDFCHMKMKLENPAYSLVLAGERGLLYGIHLNDGYGISDDGLMVGSINLTETLEFLYYMKKYQYAGVIYFDTFPRREDPSDELATNVRLLERYLTIIDAIGLDYIQKIVGKNDAVAAQEILFKSLAQTE